MFRFDIDRLRFEKFKVDVTIAMDDKFEECAPAYGIIWADALAEQIRSNFTGKK